MTPVVSLVSLVSGHVGGADELAQQVADVLGATAVITSASHVKDTLAVDLLGREFGWQVDSDSATVTRVSAAVVNGEPVGIVQEAGERNWWSGGKGPAPQRSGAFRFLGPGFLLLPGSHLNH